MRLLIILLASFSISACSTIPESWKLPTDLGSWKFDVDFWNSEKESSPTESVKDVGLTPAEPLKNSESAKKSPLSLMPIKLRKSKLGRQRMRCLRFLVRQLMLIME